MKKRAFDIVFTLLASPVIALVMPILYLGTRISVGSPAIFRQERSGKGGNPFTVYKFRSMKDGVPLLDEQRVTKFGRFMRSTGLDELPQFVNVLKGDMSVVGPRPRKAHPPYNDTDFVIRDNPEILNARPGLASERKIVEIKERRSLSLEEQASFDLMEANRPESIMHDFNVVASVLPALLGRNQHIRKRAVEAEAEVVLKVNIKGNGGREYEGPE